MAACQPAISAPTFVPTNPTQIPTNTQIAPTTVPPTPTRIPTKTPVAPLSVDTIRLGQHAYVFQASNNVEVRYLLYLPETFEPAKQWPLILFLHGSGQTGTTIDRLKQEPLPKTLETQTDLPFIVVSPQLPGGSWSTYIDPLEELLDSLGETLPVDPNRLYLTGLSLGGFGTWEYAYLHPDRFAAIAPIAGGYQYRSREIPEDICRLKDLPIWAFHGEKDRDVEPYHGQLLVDAIQACGGKARITVYPDTGHQVTWWNAYADPALYEWFLANSK